MCEHEVHPWSWAIVVHPPIVHTLHITVQGHLDSFHFGASVLMYSKLHDTVKYSLAPDFGDRVSTFPRGLFPGVGLQQREAYAQLWTTVRTPQSAGPHLYSHQQPRILEHDFNKEPG